MVEHPPPVAENGGVVGHCPEREQDLSLIHILVLKYLENDIGGLANMQKINEAKAKVLYDYLDGQDFYNNPVEHRYRSTMNVTFTSPNPDMDKKFCACLLYTSTWAAMFPWRP